MKKYATLAKHIIDGVGGADNIKQVINTPTCLHLSLWENEKADLDQLSDLPVGTQSSTAFFCEYSDTYQVVVGEEAKVVYETIIQQLTNGVLRKGGKYPVINFLTYVITVIVHSLTPVISLLAAGGLMASFLTIFAKGNHMVEILDTNSPTYIILNTMSMVPFYFLPVTVGFSAARLLAPHDRSLQFGSAAVGCFLIDPGLNRLTQMVIGTNSLGQSVIVPAPPPVAHLFGVTFNTSFFGIPIFLPNFAYMIIPMILGVIIVRPFSEWLSEHLPDFARIVLQTLIVCFVQAVIILLAIGPVLTLLSTVFASIVHLLLSFNLGIAGIIIGGFYQLLVIFGLHELIQPIISHDLATTGQSSLNMIICFTMIAQATGALTIAVKSRIASVKGLGLLSAVTAFAGLTEPALYGLNLRYQKVFLYSSIGSAIASGFAGFMGLQMFGYNGALTGFSNFIKNPLTHQAPAGNFVLFWVTTVICVVITAYLVWRYGYDITVTPKWLKREKVIDDSLFDQ